MQEAREHHNAYLRNEHCALFGPYNDQMLEVPQHRIVRSETDDVGCDSCRELYYSRVPWDRLPDNCSTQAVLNAFKQNGCEAYKIMQAYVRFCRNTCQLIEDPSIERWKRDENGVRQFIRIDDVDVVCIDRLPKIRSQHGPYRLDWDEKLRDTGIPFCTPDDSPDGLYHLALDYIKRHCVFTRCADLLEDELAAVDINNINIAEYTENRSLYEHSKKWQNDNLDGWQHICDGLFPEMDDIVWFIKSCALELPL